jgi:RNA polymerase sigma-70 factor, ECF subfamily
VLQLTATNNTGQIDEDLGAAFARLKQSLRGYLRKRTHDDVLADDLLQDIFVKALSAERAGARFENLTGWLYATARNAVVDHYRAAGKPTEALDENMPSVEVDDMRLHQALSACMRPFVEQLAPLYRDTLIATDIDGHTMCALAEKERVSVSAIKSRASRARAMLKAKLLACCRIEMQDGLVSDCARISPSGCRVKNDHPAPSCKTYHAVEIC